jgi:TonB-linked SusC/RagA family outer membrane protein
LPCLVSGHFTGYWDSLFSQGVMLANHGHAQDVKSVRENYITIEFQNSSLVDAFSQLEEITGYHFAYENSRIDKKVRLNRRYPAMTSVSDILLDISEQANVKFRQVNKTIIVSQKKGELKEGEAIQVIIDGITITGRVTSSEDNSGLPGVNVIVKGTSQGTVTDIEGNYILEVPDQNSVVVFSSVGFLREEVIPGSRTVIDLALTPDMTALEEIVVIGYGTAKKQDLTGSIATVNIENSKTLPNANVIQSFRNTVAGVTVTDNGRPGADVDILIRGRNSISASNAPLIVLDGVIYTGGSLADINPGDIESIHILKDASSTAIYGALAANGVIEVTTKKGTTQKPSISINTFYGVSDFAFIPDRLNAEQYIAVRKDAEAADGGEIPFQPIELENMANGTSIDPWEEIRQSAPTYNGELSVSGKADRVNYYMSGNYITSKSPVAGDNFSRISGRLNLNAIVTDWLNIGLNTGYTSKDFSGNRANLTDASYLSPWGSLYYDDGVPIRRPQNVGLVGNPLFGTIWNDREQISNTLFVNAYTGVELPLEGLNYKLNVGFTQRNDRTFIYNNSYDRDEFFNLGSGSKNYYEVQNFTLENIVKYSKVFNVDNEFNATLLYGIYEFNDDGSFLSSNNIWNDALGWNGLEIGEGFNINTSARQSQQTSAMARIGYRYKGKYIIDASIRRDGYSAFGEGNKYGDFPSVGVSWVLSNENFISQSKQINNLKVRLSWGKNGNRGVNPYSSLSNVAGTNYIFGDIGAPSVGQYITTMANPNLGWETTASTNLGIDFGVFNNRINGSMDFYISQTSDLLLSQTIPNTNGFETFLRNIGETENKGFELSLNTVNVIAGDFTWGSNIAFTLNRNRIVKFNRQGYR